MPYPHTPRVPLANSSHVRCFHPRHVRSHLMTWIKACLLKRSTPNLPPEALTTPKVAWQATTTAMKTCRSSQSKRRSCRQAFATGVLERPLSREYRFAPASSGIRHQEDGCRRCSRDDTERYYFHCTVTKSSTATTC